MELTLWIAAGLVVAGIFAGAIDSIAGGGGILTMPLLALVVGAGPQAIGTNKVNATVATLVAFLVYLRKGHFRWGEGVIFAAIVGVGSWAGSQLSVFVPREAFRPLLLATCPVILWIVWRKDLWVGRQLSEVLAPRSRVAWATLLALGLACGLYDGVWGPGGGTFMFLALLFVARMPLFGALACSKLANLASGAAALAGYARLGQVHWAPGACMAAGMALGALGGASLASRRATSVVRPALAVAAGLLCLKVVFG